jgi:hypothetical protein
MKVASTLPNVSFQKIAVGLSEREKPNEKAARKFKKEKIRAKTD